MATTSTRHRVVIVGGGAAGITVAARLRRKGLEDIAVIEPSDVHYYHPLWTMVAGGQARASETVRTEASVMPAGVTWIRDKAMAVDPDRRTVGLGRGGEVGYDVLVMATGLQLDFDAVTGLEGTLGRNGVSSHYEYDLAPKTWENVKNLRGGTALFTAPPAPFKCGGAPQKIAYLASSQWEKMGRLQDIQVILAMPAAAIFQVPAYAEVLMKVVDRYGIDLRLGHELVEVNPDSREATLIDRRDGGEEKVTVAYDLLNAVPPQSAPDWVKQSPLAGADAKGWISVDKATLQHTRFPEVFALGDVSDVPTSKTGAAVRKQAPVVVENLLAWLAGTPLPATYEGYTSCPLITGRRSLLLAEFGYDQTPTPSIPLQGAVKERRSHWYLKRYALPAMYWNGMLKGRA